MKNRTTIPRARWADRTIGRHRRGLFREEELVPELLPSRSLFEDRGRLDEGEPKIVEAALHTRAGRHAPHRLEELLPFRGENEIGEEQGRVWMRRVSGWMSFGNASE